MQRHGDIAELQHDRRDALLHAGIEAFGKHGYKDARTEDIARRAGISKGLLFFYFRNKRDFYAYLVTSVRDAMVRLVIGERYWKIDDFFELMLYCAELKIDLFDRYPYIVEFSVRAFYPNHRDISETVGTWMYDQVDELLERYFHHVRTERFRDGVTMRDACDKLIWLADGYMHQKRCLGQRIVWTEMMADFREWCDMVRGWAYKPEFL